METIEKQYTSPKDILEDGVKFMEAGEYNKALIAFNTLLNYHGDDSLFLFYLGSVHMRLGNDGLAKVLLKCAIAKREEFPEAWNNLGFCYHSRGEYKDAQQCFERAIQIEPDNADLLNNIASIYVNNGTPQECINWCEKALKIKPDHQNAIWNLGLAHLELGHWEEGFKGYRAGMHEAVGNRKKRNYHNDKETPEWEGTAGKSVVVYGEQGLGDEIMFASIIPDAARDARIIFDCHPRLQNIFQQSFPDIPIYGTRKENIIFWPQWEKIDGCIHIGNLGGLYRKKDSDFPKTAYLKSDPWLTQYYQEKLEKLGNGKANIVIHWKGGTLKTNRDYRSMPLENMSEIILNNSDKANFISLQYTPGAAESVAQFNEKHGTSVHHWQSTVDDIDDVAAVLANADLVISVCTAIVHLSGAMGIDCWCLCPSRPAWRYGVAGDMPWYGKNIRMFRQTGDTWETVLNDVDANLKEYLEKKSC